MGVVVAFRLPEGAARVPPAPHPHATQDEVDILLNDVDYHLVDWRRSWISSRGGGSAASSQASRASLCLAIALSGALQLDRPARKAWEAFVERPGDHDLMKRCWRHIRACVSTKAAEMLTDSVEPTRARLAAIRSVDAVVWSLGDELDLQEDELVESSAASGA